MSHASRIADGVAISLMHYGAEYVEVKNTKIINNEIVNAGDGFQAVRHNRPSDGKLQDANCEGTILDGNDIYIDSSIYTDGNGNYTPNGEYAYAEDAIDLKIGSDNASNPIVISNNHMWGSRESDRTGSLTSSHGGLIVVHYGVKNVLIHDNVMFDSLAGIGSGDNNRFPYSMSASEIKRNIFYEIGNLNGIGGISAESFYFADQNADIVIQDNMIKDGRGQQALFWTATRFNYTNNVIINQEESGINTSTTYRNTDTVLTPNQNYTTDQGIAAGYTKDYTFTTDKFTNTPRVISLKNVLKVN